MCHFLLIGFERLVDAQQVGDVVEVTDLHVVDFPVSAIAKEEGSPGMLAGVCFPA